MKKLLLLFVLASVALAQQAPRRGPTSNLTQREEAPSVTDMYCAGFISSQPLPTASFVAGGWESPDATRFGEHDTIYIAGSNLPEGSQYSIVRELRDPNRSEPFPGQRRAVAALGSPYGEMARVRIIGHGNKMNIARVEFSCDTIVIGDIAVPFTEKPALAYRTVNVPLDRFAPPNGRLGGRILMAKDFDFYAGTGRKLYLDVGSEKGVKPGDYFRVVRNAVSTYHDPLDSLSNKANIAEETQKHPPSTAGAATGGPSIDVTGFPRRSIGEMMVLTAGPKSATAIVTYALEEIRVGDNVEMEEPPPPPPPAPAPRPPMVSCTAQPPAVRAGDAATISCDAASPDNRPVSLSFAADRGRLTPSDSNATLDTTNLQPGPVMVTATATDDRGLSTAANAGVNVMAPPAPPPPPAAERAAGVQFKRGSSYVDNRAKAVLDQVALRLAREADARAVVVGMGNVATASGKRLAGARAGNVKGYLSRDKGIDAGRIEARSASGGDAAEIWIVPSGARMP